MNRFLLYFQRYIFSKNYVLMDLEFMILDTFDNIRPKLVKFQTEDEADEACKSIEDLES
jgi:regulator of nonsense transcripts 2